MKWEGMKCNERQKKCKEGTGREEKTLERKKMGER